MEGKETKRAAAGTSKKRKSSSRTAGARSNTSRKKVQGRSHKKSKNLLQTMDLQHLIMGGGIFLLLILVFFGIRSCAFSRNSPEKVVKQLIKAYGNGNAKKAKKCYKVSESSEEIVEKEIDATIRYFQAHKPEKVTVGKCGVLSSSSTYTYVYILYDLELENGQAYPCISTYMTGADKGKYYVYPPSDVTQEMSRQAAKDYEKFMTTSIYKNYVTAYETFIKKNPGYEDKIAGRLQ